jgi:hypothetical protein
MSIGHNNGQCRVPAPSCLPVVARPRLPGSTGPIPEALASVQVSINDVARSVVGHKREDHVPIVDLLEAAKFLSLNQQVVRSTAEARLLILSL